MIQITIEICVSPLSVPPMPGNLMDAYWQMERVKQANRAKMKRGDR